MSGHNDSENVRRDRPNDLVAEYASKGRSSKYQGAADTRHSRHHDGTTNDARPRYVQREEPSSRRHRDDTSQDAISTLDSQDRQFSSRDRHASSKDRAGRDRTVGPQHEDTDSGSESTRNYQVQNRNQAGQRTSRSVPEPHSREAIAAARAHVKESISPQRPVFQSRLGQLARVFASIEVDEYNDCKRFITERPDILDENESDFIRDAIIALASSQNERVSHAYARRCIQQSLLLRHCKQRDRKGREKFFSQLEEEERKTAVDFLKESEVALVRCLEKAQELHEAPSNRQPAPAAAATTGTLGLEFDSRHHSRPDGLSRGISTLNIESSGHQRHGPTDRDTMVNPRPSNVSETQERRHRRPSVATTVSNPNAAPVINQSGLLRPKEGTLIRGTTGRQEALDASYFKRERASDFFIKGRVFALLWHEAAGESNNDRVSEISIPGRFDEPIISHIRRMVVVREGHGNCWAIPINTYRRYGVAKHGFKKVDVDGHAVIHAANTEPYTSPDEPIMSKVPLKVNMARGERLDRMSRINFTTVHTVQHNVKVKNIGMVHQSSQADLRDYWSAQFAA